MPDPIGKPSNDIDKAIVTMTEVEYDKLRDIESAVKELFLLARDVKGVVAFGRPKVPMEEHQIIQKLRKLTGF